MTEIILPVILGPTATGKTKIAAHTAYYLQGEIISADSRQVYTKMTIGTGKDYDDYIVNEYKIPYHLIDIKEPGYKYNLYEYQCDFEKAFQNIIHRGKQPIVCGGTGLYLEAIIKNYNLYEVPEDSKFRKECENKSFEELKSELLSIKNTHNTTDFDSKKRTIRALEIARHEILFSKTEKHTTTISYKPVVIGIDISRETRRNRIENRFYKRLHEGMIQEVENLLHEGIAPDDLIYYGLEYKYITNYILGNITKKQLEEELLTAIFQFAKRQMTWFRGMERRGIQINWINGKDSLNQITDNMLELLKKYS